MPKIQKTLGFVGSGQMAKAMAVGFLNEKLLDSDQIAFADPNQLAVTQFSEATAGTHLPSNVEVVERSAVVFLAVKPQYYEVVKNELRDRIDDTKILVSIVGGIDLARLSADFGSQRVVRVMPNTPCMIGKGAIGFCCGGDINDDDRSLIRLLLESTGVANEVPDRLINCVTGLSGSGPAYVYTFIESLADGGVNMGLDRKTAHQLAVQTVLGAAELVRRSGQHTAVLRDQVTSPGGTTIAGLQALEENAFRGAVMSAVEAATLRAEELGN